MDMRDNCLRGLPLDGKTILEIGPLNRPVVRTDTTFYADHCSTDELRSKYAADPHVNISDIVDVHFDLSKTSIIAAGQEVGGFDLVVASHVVEHVPDLIGWLSNIHEALKPGGVLALVVPDKTYTFDIFRRETEYWMLKEAADEKRTRPSLRQVMEHFINIVSADTGALWGSPEAKAEFRPSISAEAIGGLIPLHQSGAYIDAHCWIVTPNTFETLLGQIKSDNPEINFEVEIFPTPRNQLEFYVQLRKPTRVFGNEPLRTEVQHS